MQGRARSTAILMATAAAAVAMPSEASAHGFFDRADLPIPQWLFGWAAAIVLIVSFAALGALWSKPKFSEAGWRPLPAGLGRLIARREIQVVCRTFGAALLVITLWSGFEGQQVADHNFTPTFVYVIFWVGLVPASVLLGDVFRAFNPWRAIAHAAAAIWRLTTRRQARAPFDYPSWLGYWPAVTTLAGFALLELVLVGGMEPRTIALAASIYSVATLTGMALFGIESWLDRGEGFSVYYNLCSRVSVFERRGDTIGLRPPLAGVATFRRLPGTPLLLTVMIGSITFDGIGEGPTGQSVITELQGLTAQLGLGTAVASQAALALSLLVAIGVVFGFYRLGIGGVRRVGGGFPARRLAAEFAPSLVPIAMAYVAAHYLTLFVYQGQVIVPLASDPLGNGNDFFGTASTMINHDLLSSTAVWYMQVGLVVSGHVAGLMLAHDRALVLYPRARQALYSQCWMLAVMIGFTVLALWLLSQVSSWT